jgi:hypothetical protein
LAKAKQPVQKVIAKNNTAPSAPNLPRATHGGQQTGAQAADDEQVAQVEKKAEEAKKLDLAAARQVANVALADSMKPVEAEQAKDAVQATPTRRVLTVPEQDVARVLGDLQRMAEASGGQLAWLPAADRRTAKKESAVAQRAFKSTGKSQPDRVVIRVPQENMDVLLRAATAYQTERELDRQVADAKPEPQPQAESLDPLQTQQQRKARLSSEKYVQLVVEILPQAMAEASRDEINPPAKAKIAPTKQ